jgi:hypothetical protein
MQSNLKLNLNESKQEGWICLASGPICPARGRICPGKLDLAQQKSRSGAKTMSLGLNKLTTSKLDNIELDK